MTSAYLDWLVSDIQEKEEVNNARFLDEQFFQMLTEIRTQIEKGHPLHVIPTQ